MAKILVVDDEDQLRTMVVECLRSHAHAVSEATGGDEALRRFNILDFDLLITDLIMPKGEGIEFIRKAKKLNPGIPIIAVSGGGTYLAPEFLGDLSVKLGAKYFLTKPFDLKVFLTLVEELIAVPVLPV